MSLCNLSHTWLPSSTFTLLLFLIHTTSLVSLPVLSHSWSITLTLYRPNLLHDSHCKRDPLLQICCICLLPFFSAMVKALAILSTSLRCSFTLIHPKGLPVSQRKHNHSSYKVFRASTPTFLHPKSCFLDAIEYFIM